MGKDGKSLQQIAVVGKPTHRKVLRHLCKVAVVIHCCSECNEKLCWDTQQLLYDVIAVYLLEMTPM